MLYIAGFITQIVGRYFSSLTIVFMTIMAVERSMAAYEPKISSYSRPSHYLLYHVCSFANCVFGLSHVQLVSYKIIFQHIQLFWRLVFITAYFKIYRIIRSH